MPRSFPLLGSVHPGPICLPLSLPVGRGLSAWEDGVQRVGAQWCGGEHAQGLAPGGVPQDKELQCECCQANTHPQHNPTPISQSALLFFQISLASATLHLINNYSNKMNCDGFKMYCNNCK